MITAEEATATITSQANELRILRESLGQFQQQHTLIVTQLQGEKEVLQRKVDELTPKPAEAEASA